MQRDELILWRDVPVDVDIKTYEYIASQWGAKVIVFSVFRLPEERLRCEMTGGSELFENIVCENEKDYREKAEELVKKYPYAINVFSGIRGVKHKYFKRIAGMNGKLVILTERHVASGNHIKKEAGILISGLYYKLVRILYSGKVGCILAMGERGCKEYLSYGWGEAKVFPYMYCSGDEPSSLPQSNNEKTAFLYVGRSDCEFKGVDVLIYAAKMLAESRFTLTFVGRYGADTELVNEYVNTHKNAFYIDKWSSADVVDKMTAFDVCIVPSRCDGWNLSPNHALNAGIGIIVTDECVSDELITASGAGAICKAGDAAKLAEEMRYVIENPQIKLTWHRKAEEYRYRISAESVGNYFIDIMESRFYNAEKTAECPWLGR